MPQIMAETFARGLVDKLMVQVLDVIDRGAQNGKPWEQHADDGTVDEQSASIHERSRACEHTHVNYSKAEEVELIAKIIRDLRDIQIGDSRYVLPPSVLALEKQVKCATCSADSATFAKIADAVETRTARSQGDTYRTAQAVLGSPTEAESTDKAIRKEKEGATTSEAASVSVDLLLQLIERLKNETRSKDDAPARSTGSKERVATWEEKEEELIRTIEGTSNTLKTSPLQESESTDRFRVVELKRDELRSRSSQHVASVSREDRLELQLEKSESTPLTSSKHQRDHFAVSMEEIVPVDNATDARRMSDEEPAKKKKKRGFGGRLRKLFRAAFGRRKN